MTVRGAVRRTAFAAGLLVLAAAIAAAGTATTRISYLSGGAAYIEAGKLDGVEKGDTLDVVGAEGVVAKLRVTFTSTRRAACDTLWTRRPLALGDGVRFAPHTVAAATTPGANGVPQGVARASAVRHDHHRGTIGARWLAVDGGGSSFQQPALDLRFDGSGAGGGHVDMSIDVRTRRTTRDFSGIHTNEQLSRVYRASMTMRSVDSHRQLTVGRQSSPTLSSIALFDGVLAQTGNDRHAFGLFSGTQPDPLDLGLSRDILESGLFAEWHALPQAENRWSFATGGVTSQENGQPNRDFLFAQSWWSTKRFSGSFTQELDVNRGWKRAQGEPLLTSTNTFASMRVPVTKWLALTSGYDNRRSVRLWRDHLTPETQFDDQYREGAWGGAQLSLGNHVRLGGDARSSVGGDRAHSWSTSGEFFNLTHFHFATHARASRFYSGSVDSRLTSLGLGVDPWAMSHVEFTGGERRTSSTFLTSGVDSEHWMGVDFDFSFLRRWYLSGGWEHDRGGIEGQTRQVTAGLSVRF